MVYKCNFCDGELVNIKKKVLVKTSKGQLLIEAESSECMGCGETFFNENQSKEFAEKIDRELLHLEEKKPILVKSGSLII